MKFKQQRFVILFIAMAIWLITWGCNGIDKIHVPDTSNIEITFDTVRYEKLLFQIDTNQTAAELENIRQSYPSFYNLYFQRILPIPSFKDGDETEFARDIEEMLKFPSIVRLYDTVTTIYPSISDLYPEFEQAFTLYAYYFPERSVPNIYTFISEFGYGAILFSEANGQDGLAIGLDLFLGDAFDYTQLADYGSAFSQYLTKSFAREYIVRKSMAALIEDLSPPPSKHRMIDQLILEGKKMYVLEKLIPYVPDSILWEYSESQVDWVKGNEWNMWAYLVDGDLLYSTELSKFHPLLREAPNSKGMPPEAPGRAIVFLGYKIVASYMQKFPETTFNELMQIDDGQFILDKSRYRPER